MTFQTAESFQRRLVRQRTDLSLDQPFYNDSHIFQQDAEQVFMRHWLFAGHESRIANAGEYFVFEVAGEQIIVARTADGQIGAMFNVYQL
jgi:Rieske 2Fe-2S family protein